MHKGGLFVALAGVAAFVALGPREQDVARDSPGAGEALHAEPELRAGALRIRGRQGLSQSRGELFAAPRARPAPVAAPPPPAAPAAPPLPYRFAGVVRHGGETQVLIARGERVFPIEEGETLDGAYRVASITAERIELLYLPLGTTERIAVASALDPKPDARMPVAAAAAPAVPAARPADAASLRWEGPGKVRAGSSVSVALHLSYDGPLRAAPMQLRFEPGVVESLSVRAGKFLQRGQFSYRVNADGSILVGASAAGASPGADAELLVVTFRPVKAGATAGLSMAALSLQGAAGGPVAYAQLDDYRAAIVP